MSNSDSIPAAFNSYGIAQEADAVLKLAVEALFNEDFVESDNKMASLPIADQQRPISHLIRVIRYWWEISVKVLETDEDASKSFQAAADQCIKISQENIKRNRHSVESHVALATTWGLLSRWAAANRSWLSAYSRGQKSANTAEKALRLNPAAADAYLALGTFHYAQDLIRKLLGTEKTFESNASLADQGLRELRTAYQKGDYLSAPAGLMLAGLLTNTQPQKAVPLLQELRLRFPKSAFVHMTLIIALYNAGLMTELEAETEKFESEVNNDIYPRFYRPQAAFALAMVHFKRNEWKKAARHFNDAIESGSDDNPYLTWALLYQAYCYDVLGQRQKAKTNYQAVLGRPRKFSSHIHARNRLDQPFSASDPEINKLEL